MMSETSSTMYNAWYMMNDTSFMMYDAWYMMDEVSVMGYEASHMVYDVSSTNFHGIPHAAKAFHECSRRRRRAGTDLTSPGRAPP
jgi:hypothetical protein